MLNPLRRLRESVATSAMPELQRGTTTDDDTELEESAPSQAERDKAADNGDAFSDGSYPITSQTQADNAWKLRNSSKNHSEASVVAHIRKQVKKHDLTMPGKTQESAGEIEALGTIILREAAPSKHNGIYEVTVVREGPGNPSDANYYTADALREAVSKGLFEGLQAYINHPTVTEERDRPERDVRHLAGHFREARFVPGAPAEVRAKFVPGGMDKDRVVSLIESAIDSPKTKPLIGISIDGFGHAPDQQDIGGRTYNIVREVTHLGSADIVTRAGAGGMFHRRLQEAWRDTGTAERRPETSKEANMKPAQLQEEMKAALGKLSEAADLKDDQEKADGLIKDGFALLRECAAATIEPEIKIQEKVVEKPVAANGEKADELAAKLQDAETRLQESETARKTAEDRLAANETARIASKVLREKQVPEKSARAWFDAVAACGDESSMTRLVEAKMAERAEIIADFRAEIEQGVEGAGPRLRESTTGGAGNGDEKLLADLGIDPELVA